MRPMRRILASGLLLVALLVAAPSAGLARSDKTLAYPRDQAWATAVRFIAVDEGAKILQKDSEAGYVLFELRDDGKTYRGSLEVVAVTVDGHPSVRFVITLVDRPSWMELSMLQRLQHKLRAELGSPTPPPTKPKAPPKEPSDPGARPGRDEPPKQADPKDEPPLSRVP